MGECLVIYKVSQIVYTRSAVITKSRRRSLNFTTSPLRIRVNCRSSDNHDNMGGGGCDNCLTIIKQMVYIMGRI